mmetsp:Transcript_6075/g.12929  ORF Transcript_6075/g.12929 Transcript_6075/m.12929 type:complete len:335 (-) Transcript_6075:603-1607(-)
MDASGACQQHNFVDVSETSARGGVSDAEDRRQLIERLNKIDPETARVQFLERAKPELASRLRHSRTSGATRAKRTRSSTSAEQQRMRAPSQRRDTAFFFCQNLIRIFAEDVDEDDDDDILADDDLESSGSSCGSGLPQSLAQVKRRLESDGYEACAGGSTDVRRFANDVRFVVRSSVLTSQNDEEEDVACSEKRKLAEARLEQFELAMVDLVSEGGICDELNDCSDSESAVTESVAVVPKSSKKKKQRVCRETSSSSKSSSVAELELIPLTYTQKRQLGESICRLPEAKLAELIQLVSRLEGPSIVGLEDEIELDIDSMSTSTLRKLEEFVFAE